MSSPGDLLAGAGLLIAAETLFYTLWYEDIQRAAAAETKRYKEDNVGMAERVRRAQRDKALPLFLAALSTCLILARDCCRIVFSVWRYVASPTFRASATYDPVLACLVFAEVVALFLAVHSARQVWSLNRKWAELSGRGCEGSSGRSA